MVRILGKERAIKLKSKSYKTTAMLHELRAELTRLNDTDQLSDTRLWMLDAQIAELSKALGGCERIASTPIPYSYSVLLHRTVYTYCMLLPFGLVDAVEVFTPLLCVFLSYTLIAMEAIADEIAEPFGLAPNALALDAITRHIERSLQEQCEREMPEDLTPDSTYRLT